MFDIQGKSFQKASCVSLLAENSAMLSDLSNSELYASDDSTATCICAASATHTLLQLAHS